MSLQRKLSRPVTIPMKPAGSKSKNASSEHLVLMKDVTVRFGRITALDKVNFRVDKNEIVGLLGNNGAGKSTLIKTLIGFHKPSSGEIYIEGNRATFKSPKFAYREGIEVAFQELALAEDRDILQNFFLGRELRKNGFIRLLDYPAMRKVLKQYFDQVGFNVNNYNEGIRYLPGGVRQSFEIFRANYFARKLLILDEPTAALSESETEKVIRMVKKTKERGLSVIFITHSAHEVFRVADRFIILQNGRNYTELKKDDTSIREIERLLISSRLSIMKEIVANVAHQIRNPLGIMKFSAEMLRDDFPKVKDDEIHNRFANVIVSEAESLENIVNNFLNFAHPPSFTFELHSIEDLVNTTVKGFEYKDGVHLNVKNQKSNLKYLMDFHLMKQALANIIMNSIEASSTTDTVEIRTKNGRDYWTIEVEDSGKGIDKDALHALFHPFYTTKSKGTGLGLSITKHIIDQHGGTIQIRSSPGKGTTVEFTIRGQTYEKNFGG